MTPRTVSWFSCGAASAVATKIMSRERAISVAYCETGSEHPDNERFLFDCETWFGHRVERLKNPDYADTWAVWEKHKYIAGIDGAPCTGELKVGPRLLYQQPTDIHVFGYTYDKRDMTRADLLRENYPELTLEYPLIDRKISKAACLAIVASAGIKLPVLYGLGFHNNNCLPCPKATSPNYWSLIRKEFPAEFARMVELSRRLDVRLTRIKNVRIFIDEIPPDWPTTDPIQPSCDFLCDMITQEIDL